MIMLKAPWKDGAQCSYSTVDDLDGLTPLEMAKQLFANNVVEEHPGEYVLVDYRVGYEYPLTKKGVPSRVRKYVRHETELGRFTAEQLK